MSAKESTGFDRDIDWASIGLPDRSPFAILSRPKAAPRPPKPKSKQKSRTMLDRTLAALSDPEESRFSTHMGIKGHVS